jgi:ubiquinone biosynthesis protein COQ4
MEQVITVPRGPIGRLVVGFRAFRNLITNPADPLQGPLFQMCVEHSMLRRVTRGIERHEEGRRLLAERPRLNAHATPLSTMEAHPPQSLGRAYAAYFGANNITPFDPPALPVDSNQDYITTRLRETHDVVHVVTGYGTDDIGELELQWFNFGNLGWARLPFIVFIAAFFMGRMKKYGGVWRVWKRAWAAYRRGRRSRPLASVIWEDFWELPVQDVQTLLCAPA